MLIAVVGLLLIGWLIGMATSNIFGGVLHLLLLGAVAGYIFEIVAERNKVTGKKTV
jgi:hypothetical protein